MYVCIYIYIYTPHLLCPFICQWTLRLLPRLAAMDTEVHVSFRIRVFSKYMPRSGVAFKR